MELGRALAIGNVDNDNALELVFSGGFVYDGITYGNEWSYSEEFGWDIVLADVRGDGTEEIIAHNRSDTSVYDAIQKSVVLDFTEGVGICSIAAANLDSDPESEILVGDCHLGRLYAYDADSGSAMELWSANTLTNGITSLAVGDVDQDVNLEILWGAGLISSGEDSLVVFDSVNRTIDFQNTDPSQLDGPFIGGQPVTGNGVVFATVSTDSGYEGSRILSLDYDTGDMAITPELGSNWSGYFDFCVSDYDQDGTEEILFSSAELYTGFLSAYDLFSSAEEWSVTGSYDTVGDVACGDANGDGYTDLAAIWGPSIRVYDPFNQVLLWSSPQLTSQPEQIAFHDLDGNAVPEILALHDSRLVVYARSGSIYVEDSTYAGSGPEMYDMFVGDIDGDQEPEIVISINEGYYPSETTTLVILNSDLGVEKSLSIDERITAITAVDNADNTLLIATSLTSSSAGPEYYIKFIDIDTADIIWNSPPLLGEVMRDSLHIVQKPGSTKKQLAVGTRDAMYLTQ